MASWTTVKDGKKIALEDGKKGGQTSVTNGSATKRLAKDLKEVLRNPLPNIAARPLENNLFVWHVNARFACNGKMKGSVIHLILTFPKTYPSSPPSLQLCTPLPHANVERVIGTDKLTICLDLLTPP